MWGDEHGIAVTRSNTAVTRFEPIQRLDHASTTLYRLAGDGRNALLDLFVDEIPNTGARFRERSTRRFIPSSPCTHPPRR